MKKINFTPKLLGILLIFLLGFIPEVSAKERIKVACIGNSITANVGQDKDQRYPAILEQNLGAENYEVRNYGQSGRTMLRTGDSPYWNTTAYREALSWNPDIVIIKLGTNDSKPKNWDKKSAFQQDYIDFINSFKNLTSKPKIYVCYPLPAFAGNTLSIDDQVVTNEVIPLITAAAEATESTIIDLHTPFLGKDDMTSDHIHPTFRGTTYMAYIIKNVLVPNEGPRVVGDDYTSYLKNPSFEYKEEGIINDGSALRGTPYGWKDQGTLLNTSGNLSYGINNEAKNKVGINVCWAQSPPMPEAFTLYQEVEGLPAGKYVVSCRLVAFTNKTTNLRLFANNNVQYYGTEADYNNILTAGETNTYANWAATPESTTPALKPMSVVVEIGEGETLKLGIKTSNKKNAGGSASDNSGWFKVDDFRVTRYSEAADPNDYTSKITNPSFELDAEGKQIHNETVRNTPYGWSQEGTISPNGTTLSYGCNQDANNMTGANCCWVYSFPLTEPFTLYQEIKDLPAGTYRVSCSMFVFDIRKTTQRLFANNNVQYFGKESSYTGLLTDGETNTFAEWNFQSDDIKLYNTLKNLSVDVVIAKGETLKLGIKTDNNSKDSAPQANRGWYKVDNFKLKLIEAAALSNDATLKEITINGQAIENFSTSTHNYEYLQTGNTNLVVVATPNDAAATATVDYPAEYPGKITIIVTAEDGSTQETYSINVTKTPNAIGELENVININVENGQVVVGGISSNDVVRLYSITGQLLTETCNNIIHLPYKGAYVVKVTTDNSTQTKKVVFK